MVKIISMKDFLVWNWDDLDEATQEHIIKCVGDGYECGEIVMETDDEDDDEDEDDDDE